jgi:hypothetical protein
MRLFLIALVGLASSATAQESLPLGLGIASPTALSADHPLFFYGTPGGHPSTTPPFDSLTVREGPHHAELATAPPWLDAEAVKLDYDLLIFRVVALRRHWVNVVVHTREVRWPPQTMWLDREAVAFRPWEVFLLDVFSVETLEAASLRSAPSDDAAVVDSTEAGRPVRVLEVQSEWMRVEDAEANERNPGPSGWLRWHDGTRRRIRYSMLS